MVWRKACLLLVLGLFSWKEVAGLEPATAETGNGPFKIEGQLSLAGWAEMDSAMLSKTEILVDGGRYVGYVKSDGSFVVNNVPAGSYVVAVNDRRWAFEPVRVDITSKGKIRARKVNNLQPQAVQLANYPLRFLPRGAVSYFQERQVYRITDMILKNPMILMMLASFGLVWLLPRMMNQDQEAQREVQQQMDTLMNPRQNLPDISETLTNWLGGGAQTPANNRAPRYQANTASLTHSAGRSKNKRR